METPFRVTEEALPALRAWAAAHPDKMREFLKEPREPLPMRWYLDQLGDA